MNLICDIDDVLLDWTKGFDSYLKIKNLHTGISLKEFNGTIEQYLNTSKQHANNLITEFNHSLMFAKLEPKDDLMYYIKSLSRFNLTFVTSCGNTPKIKELRKHNIDMIVGKIPNKVIHLDLHKTKEVVYNNISSGVVIDDNPMNCEMAKKLNHSSILYSCSHNLNYTGLQRVSSWKEIFKILELV